MLLMELLHFLPLKFWFFLIYGEDRIETNFVNFTCVGCLSLAELGRRGLLLPSRLPDGLLFFLCSILSLLCKIYCLSLLERLSDEANKPCLPGFAIRVVLLPCTVCPQHLLYLVLPSWPFMRSFPYPQHGDMGGSRSAPALPAYQQCLCIQLTSDAEVHA